MRGQNKSSFSKFAASTVPLISADLHKVILEVEHKYANKIALKYFRVVLKIVNSNGKLIRPLSFILIYRAYQKLSYEKIINIATSLELLHIFLLIHDDIIDRDLERWGGPNITGVYYKKFRKTMAPAEAMHMAESFALLAGDLCMTMANNFILNSDFPPAVIVEAQKLLQAATMQVIGGEIADTANSFAAKPPSEADILQMYQDKTASYSFCLPLQMGALLAGASKKEQALLVQIGNHLGIAYQLQDDLLGMFGTKAKTGKPVSNDLREGKRTVLMHYALAHAAATDQALLQQALGNKDLTAAQVKKVQGIIKQSGAEQYTIELAQKHSDQAIKLIAKTTMNQLGKDRLVDLVHLLTGREQ